tara:strand:+ start:33 stop:725 length:693 start_codon:yes stop_codon:yes gene_type:complete
MTILIQARMSSKRLPGKVLKKVNGIPVLFYLIQRLKISKKIEDIIVLTSNDQSDNSIYEFCDEKKIKCLRGPLKDVSKRFILAIEKYNLSSFVRICGDSPLLDYKIIEKGIKIYHENKLDIVTNIFPRSYPMGQSIEVINARTFSGAYNKFNDKKDFEHVTGFFYDNYTRYKILNFEDIYYRNNYRLVIDTNEDFYNFKKIIDCLESDYTNYDVNELIRLIEENNIKCII